ncbi:MAG: peptidoglycan DD-metalloendopeptidase family protein [Candidatus Taylorbacteria bacterium]|nr:peptidoglycan DD-metalloendopeptidase family protein [Candidatus Taylorbacteria bacterium]
MNLTQKFLNNFSVSLKLFTSKLLLCCFVIFAPHPVSAGFFSSILNDVTPEVSAAAVDVSEVNSQTMQLLQVVVNSNPNPNSGATQISMVSGGTAVISESGPAGTIADVEDATGTSISLYTVRKGDSLEKIAKIFDVSVNTILWANDLSRSSVLKEGQNLVILPISGVRHVVKSKETLKGIVNKYKADFDEVAEYNNLTESSVLAVGDVIIVPDAEIPTIVQPKLPANAAKNPTAALHGASGPLYPGYYIRPIVGGSRSQGLHGYNAVDLASPIGTIIRASAAGTVIISSANAGWNHGYGNYVVISHPNGTQTLYAHMSTNLVKVGDKVEQGQSIGRIGMTGKTTGPHVHFEIRGARNTF